MKRKRAITIEKDNDGTQIYLDDKPFAWFGNTEKDESEIEDYLNWMTDKFNAHLQEQQ